jgi:hypothetical protein
MPYVCPWTIRTDSVREHGEVVPRWHPASDSVSIYVADDQTGEEHEIDVRRADA